MLINVLIVAIVVGWLLGGRLGRLGRLQLVHPEALIGAFVLQAAAPFAPRGLRFPLLIFSYLLVLTVLVLNRRSTGAAIAAVGVLLNFIVIALNGGMPVSLAAVRALGGATPIFSDGVHVALTEATRLAWLGDIWREPFPPWRAIISAGDMLLSLGVLAIVVENMRYVGQRRKARV